MTQNINGMDINSASTAKARIGWVDVAKGLGLFLVVWGHFLRAGDMAYIERVIYSFHMPMYFILSGYLARPRKVSLGKKIMDLAYKLLLPSVIFIVITLPIYFLQLRNTDTSIGEQLQDIFFWNGQVAYNSPVWFFIVLFITVTFIEIFNVIKYSIWIRTLTFAIAFLAGFFVYQFDVFLPFGINRAIVAIGFYLFGNVINDVFGKAKKTMKPLTYRTVSTVTVLMCIVLTALIGGYLNVKVSMYLFNLGSYWLFILSGILGSVAWFGISYLLRNVSILQHLGKNTLFIVGTHYLIVSVCNVLAKYMGVYYGVVTLVITLIALLIYLPICNFINKYLPFLNGKRKRI